MFNDLYPEETAAALEQRAQQPYQAHKQEVGFTQGLGSAIADVLPYAAATSFRAWGEAANALQRQGLMTIASAVLPTPRYGAASAAPTEASIVGNPLMDAQADEQLKQTAQRFTPAPEAVGAAGQITHGLISAISKGLAYAPTGPAAPYLFGMDVGLGEKQRLQDQGVDELTALGAGAISGLSAGAGFKLAPAYGSGRLQGAASGAGINAGMSVLEMAGIKGLLQHANYDDIAAQYQPLDPINLSVQALTGAAFGAAFHGSGKALEGRTQTGQGEIPSPEGVSAAEPPRRLTPEEHAAALLMHEVQTRDTDMLTPVGDFAAANHGKDAQEHARSQLDAGQVVSVAPSLGVDELQVQVRQQELMTKMQAALLDGDGIRPLDFGHRSPEQLAAEYALMPETDGGHVIDVDLVRELSPEYRADKSLATRIHDAASSTAKELYARALARPVDEGRENTVLFLAGGGGSGKSFARQSVLGDNAADIVLDGTFSNLARARENIDAALASGREVHIVYVFRSPENAAAGAIGRAIEEGRPVPIQVLADAHAKAPEVVKAIALEYNQNERVNVEVIWNDGQQHEARIGSLDEVPYVGHTQAKDAFTNAIQSARESNPKFTDKLYEAFSGNENKLRTADGRGYAQGESKQYAAHAVEPDASPERSGPLGKITDTLSRLFGRDEINPETTPSPSLEANTPEQRTAFDWASRNPDALIPTGELHADGTPIVLRAADLATHAADIETQTQKDSEAFATAVTCALRYPA